MRVTVLVTLLNDPRVAATLDSLRAQSRPPDEILVADGGSRPDHLKPLLEAAARDDRVRIETCPGSVAETRNLALPMSTGDVIAFLDSDEVAPPGWLEALVAPIEAGAADFTGGPTRPLREPRTRSERYVNDFDAWFYPNVVAKDPTMTPMGNSAWRRAVFDAIGNFDDRLVWGGEDYDVNLRAVAAGFRGAYVPEAWVWHDQSHLSSFRRILRRKYRYSVGATVAYLKNGVLGAKAGGAAATAARFRHPYEWANVVVKPVALVAGWLKWRRLRKVKP
ncbi:MAG TPA: glycosyltransferase [Candidatus Thermoplasmatota archaeon]|nr:glycosyltransferase [Candidatus Thermoplasmatota archaeon]